MFLLSLGQSAWAADDLVAVPPLHSHVTDLTHTLSPTEQAQLEQRLGDFEAQKGSQIAVLIVPSTGAEDISAYSIRVVENWKLGRKGVDDGALLLIAKADHKMRIEVGYGLEGVLTDITSKRIISDTIAPHFKAGDFYGGIQAGVGQMMQVINGEALPAPSRNKQVHSSGLPSWLIWIIVILILGLRIFGPFVLLGGGIVLGGGRGGGFGGGGGFSGGGGGFGGGGSSGGW